MALKFFQYKSDQGRVARGIAFWLLTALCYYGCSTLYSFLFRWNWAKSNLLDFDIPVANLPLSVSLIAAVAVFLAVEMLIVRLVVNRPKMGDLLIETETEMKKVTWPSWNDAFNSSLVVLAAVVFFMILLGLSDFLLNRVFGGFVFRLAG